MTTPVDPRPYAAPTDLVTAADVAEWLRERAERALLGNCHPPTHVLHYALVDLRARLDRERRQACRRGCTAMLHEALVWRGAERESADEYWVERYHHGRRECLARALAFRAAARQP